MKFGKIKIEDGNLLFTKRMLLNMLPCKDILWAYMKRDIVDSGSYKQITMHSLVIVTRRKKTYKFDMTEKEVCDCIQTLKIWNPEISIGFPQGERIVLQSLPNTRDLGALETEDGRHILPKKLLQSGNLYHISMEDQRVLTEEYHLSKVIDLRSEEERKKRPDVVMENVFYHFLPVSEDIGVWENTDDIEKIIHYNGDIEEYIEKLYKTLITDVMSVKQFAIFVDILLHHEEGAVLWHCNMGKDRAGVATAIFLSILGVPREVIKENFKKTNAYMKSDMEYMIRFLESRMIVDSDVLRNIQAMFCVKESYLDIVFQAIENHYGDFDSFVKKGLYMNPKTVEMLRDKYLV